MLTVLRACLVCSIRQYHYEVGPPYNELTTMQWFSFLISDQLRDFPFAKSLIYYSNLYKVEKKALLTQHFYPSDESISRVKQIKFSTVIINASYNLLYSGSSTFLLYNASELTSIFYTLSSEFNFL